MSYVPNDTPFETIPELARILVADVEALDPPAGWEYRTDEPYGARYWALQRRGPLDDARGTRTRRTSCSRRRRSTGRRSPALKPERLLV